MGVGCIHVDWDWKEGGGGGLQREGEGKKNSIHHVLLSSTVR